MKNVYVNLWEDFCELFGLNSTDKCNIDFPINDKTKKPKGLAFIEAPAHTQMNLSHLMASHTMITS